MKKTIIVLAVTILFAVFMRAADDAVSLVSTAASEMKAMAQEAEFEETLSEYSKDGKKEKQQAVKKQEKQKSGKVNTGNELQPACIFSPELFFKDYGFSILKKDSRIKMGREEIIAIKTGQEAKYPQARILINSGFIERVSMYGPTGQKYYEVTAKRQENTVLVTERVISLNNTVVREYLYRNVKAK